jgi:hypothetical protein
MGISVFPAASAGPVRKSQTFTSSGTFTLPSGYGASKPLLVELEVCGGGGGGGSGAYTTSANAGSGGGGGSGVTTLFSNVPLTANATITIGAGGTGGAGISSGLAAGNDGTYGGASDVNSTYYSPGGGYGGGATTSATTVLGSAVITYGYSISSGYRASGNSGAGGSGGSGGAYGLGIAANPSSAANAGGNIYYRGGVYGLAGHSIVGEASSGSTPFSFFVGNGLGLTTNLQETTTAANGIPLPKPDLLQRGGGGAGGTGESTGTYGSGGAAGTKTSGGLTGIRNQTTGEKNGASATDPGCGGGGGGGGYNVTSGSGGNGAAGYVTVYWWE